MLDRVSKPLELNIAEISISQKYQVRVEGTDQSHIDNLAEIDLDIGDITRDYPLIVFSTGFEFILVEGWHRIEARKKNKRQKVWTICYSGTERDAYLYTLTKSNSDHGLTLSKESRVARVEKLLLDNDWGKWSIALLAEKCRESRSFIINIRKRLVREGKLDLSALEPPPNLEPELLEKWNEVKESGRTPVLMEKDGKTIVRAKRGMRTVAPKQPTSDCDKSADISGVMLGNHWTDEYGNKIPNYLKDIFIGKDSLAGIMRSDIKYLRSMPIADWMRDNPWLADKFLEVKTIEGVVKFSFRRLWDWIVTALDNSHPAAICAVCEDNDGDCPVCLNKRWLPGYLYETMEKSNEEE